MTFALAHTCPALAAHARAHALALALTLALAPVFLNTNAYTPLIHMYEMVLTSGMPFWACVSSKQLNIICITSANVSKDSKTRFQKIPPITPTHTSLAPTPLVLRTCCTLQSRSATRIFELLLFPPGGGRGSSGGRGGHRRPGHPMG